MRARKALNVEICKRLARATGKHWSDDDDKPLLFRRLWYFNQPGGEGEEAAPQIASSEEAREDGGGTERKLNGNGGVSSAERQDEEQSEEEDEEWELDDEQGEEEEEVEWEEDEIESLIEIFQRLSRQTIAKEKRAVEEFEQLVKERQAAEDAANAAPLKPYIPMTFQGLGWGAECKEAVGPRKWRDLLKRVVAQKKRPLVVKIGDKLEIVHRVDSLDDGGPGENRPGSMDEGDGEEEIKCDVNEQEPKEIGEKEEKVEVPQKEKSENQINNNNNCNNNLSSHSNQNEAVEKKSSSTLALMNGDAQVFKMEEVVKPRRDEVEGTVIVLVVQAR